MQKSLLTTAIAAALSAGGSVAHAQTEGAPTDQDAAQEGAETQEEAAATDTSDAELKDRIKSVQRKVFLKRHRFELYPYFGLDLNDPFFQHFILGLSAGYHLADSLMIEARGGFTIASVEQNVIRIIRTADGVILDNPPEFQYHADLDLSWSPIYGKMAFFGEGIGHFDLYLTGGPGVFGTDVGANPAMNLGLGTRFFITDWLTARIELRNYIFIESRNDSSNLQNLMILGFSLSAFLPTSFEYEFQ